MAIVSRVVVCQNFQCPGVEPRPDGRMAFPRFLQIHRHDAPASPCPICGRLMRIESVSPAPTAAPSRRDRVKMQDALMTDIFTRAEQSGIKVAECSQPGDQSRPVASFPSPLLSGSTTSEASMRSTQAYMGEMGRIAQQVARGNPGAASLLPATGMLTNPAAVRNTLPLAAMAAGDSGGYLPMEMLQASHGHGKHVSTSREFSPFWNGNRKKPA